MNPLYQYKAKVNKVYDGDTITDMTIDLGFGIQMREEDIRLYGINTFEMRDSKYHKRTEEEKRKAIIAKELLQGVTANNEVIIKTFKTSKYNTKDKKGKYGRWIARVFVQVSAVEFHLGLGDDLTKVRHNIESGDVSSYNLDNHNYVCVNDILVVLELATKEKY